MTTEEPRSVVERPDKRERAGRMLAVMDVLLSIYGHIETAPSIRLVRAEDFERLLAERGYRIVPAAEVVVQTIEAQEDR